jgi:hypothetical protein
MRTQQPPYEDLERIIEFDFLIFGDIKLGDLKRMDSVDLIPEIMTFARSKVWADRNWRREGWMRILSQNSGKRRFS